MKFSVLTLFPELIETYCQTSMIGRAQKKSIIQVGTVNPRDFTEDVHHKVDDTPYGGGPGMVLMCEPILKAYRSLNARPSSKTILLTPAGAPFKQAMAKQWQAETDHIVMLCGHYEGFDARIPELIPHCEAVSIGDFILTGGELAALVLIDSISRLIPGVLGDETSHQDESFEGGLLEYPHYTRPQVFEGLSVPEVLLSGHHQNIATWRKAQALERTRQFRPDLL
jgi:tRNA (guanine37-N1)-methyltransferase